MLAATPFVVPKEVEIGSVVRNELAELAGEFEGRLEIRGLGTDKEQGMDGQGAFRSPRDKLEQAVFGSLLIRRNGSEFIISGPAEECAEYFGLQFAGEFVGDLTEGVRGSLGSLLDVFDQAVGVAALKFGALAVVD